MEQKFLLCYHGKLSFSDYASMSGEERAWWMQRVAAEHERQNKDNQGPPTSG